MRRLAAAVSALACFAAGPVAVATPAAPSAPAPTGSGLVLPAAAPAPPARPTARAWVVADLDTAALVTSAIPAAHVAPRMVTRSPTSTPSTSAPSPGRPTSTGAGLLVLAVIVGAAFYLSTRLRRGRRRGR